MISYNNYRYDLKLKFKAYKHWLQESKSKEMSLPGLEKFTDEQMFFITYGQLWCGKSRDQAMIHTILNDPHSPGEFRYIFIPYKSANSSDIYIRSILTIFKNYRRDVEYE